MSTKTPTTDAETGRYTTDHDDETPVNKVRLSDDGVRQFVIDECVLCGETHWHGSMDPTVATGGRSHRAEHCHTVEVRGGYYLELAEDADPPERWYNWVDRNSGIEVSKE